MGRSHPLRSLEPRDGDEHRHAQGLGLQLQRHRARRHGRRHHPRPPLRSLLHSHQPLEHLGARRRPPRRPPRQGTGPYRPHRRRNEVRLLLLALREQRDGPGRLEGLGPLHRQPHSGRKRHSRRRLQPHQGVHQHHQQRRHQPRRRKHQRRMERLLLAAKLGRRQGRMPDGLHHAQRLQRRRRLPLSRDRRNRQDRQGRRLLHDPPQGPPRPRLHHHLAARDRLRRRQVGHRDGRLRHRHDSQQPLPPRNPHRRPHRRRSPETRPHLPLPAGLRGLHLRHLHPLALQLSRQRRPPPRQHRQQRNRHDLELRLAGDQRRPLQLQGRRPRRQSHQQVHLPHQLRLPLRHRPLHPAHPRHRHQRSRLGRRRHHQRPRKLGHQPSLQKQRVLDAGGSLRLAQHGQVFALQPRHRRRRPPRRPRTRLPRRPGVRHRLLRRHQRRRLAQLHVGPRPALLQLLPELGGQGRPQRHHLHRRRRPHRRGRRLRHRPEQPRLRLRRHPRRHRRRQPQRLGRRRRRHPRRLFGRAVAEPQLAQQQDGLQR